MKSFIIIILLLISVFISYSQKKSGKQMTRLPQLEKVVKRSDNCPAKILLPELKSTTEKTETENNGYSGAFQYGKVIPVSYNWNNSGTWYELENGDRIWKLVIGCPGAKSINLSYDKFWLPEGGTLHLYDKKRIKMIGGFTLKNNSGTKNDPKGYATGLLFSDEITLEYYEPKKVRGEGIISVSKIIVGYRDLRVLLKAGREGRNNDLYAEDVNCCPEGEAWQNEKTSVALVISNGGVFTGSLINNTRNDGTPYFLTANHNISNQNNHYDAIKNPDASDLLFQWEYEIFDCDGHTSNYDEFKEKITVGAVVVANSSVSDFALLKLKETPYGLPSECKAYFNGWDLRSPGSGNICIHHPQYKPKKIAVDYNVPTTKNKFFWKIQWEKTTNGYSIIYTGSSGAPLYNMYLNNRIIGQLLGSQNQDNIEHQTACFGKLSASWDYNDHPKRRLKDWLDPDNTGIMGIDGTFCNNNTVKNISNIIFEDNHDIFGCSVNIDHITVQNGANVWLRAANEVVITNSFELKKGATLQITTNQ